MALQADFLPNYLDEFNLATYHIKFYMLPEGTSYTFAEQDPDSAQSVIIAETGVTGQISIDNLSIKIFAPSSSNRGTVAAQEVRFTLKEHNGASMMDKIQHTANVLGIKDFRNTAYYIEITFLANNYPDGGEPVKLPIAYRWPINIKGMDATILASGTTYDVVAYHLIGHTAISTLTGINNNGPIKLDAGALKGAQTNAPSRKPVSKSKLASKAPAAAPAKRDTTVITPPPDPAMAGINAEAVERKQPLNTAIAANAGTNNYNYSNVEFNGNTVGAMLEELATTLTDRAKEEAYDSNLPDAKYTRYQINVPDEFASMRLQVNTGIQSGRHLTMSTKGNGNKYWTYTFPPNVTITQMITDIIMASPDFQKGSVNSSVPNGVTQNPSALNNLFALNVVPFGADQHEVPADTAVPDWLVVDIVPYLASTVSTPADAEAEPDVVAQYIADAGLLRKRYFYLFTGMNDQVLNLDLKFNFGWYVDAPNNGGWTGATGSSNVAESAAIMPPAQQAHYKRSSPQRANVRGGAPISGSTIGGTRAQQAALTGQTLQISTIPFPQSTTGKGRVALANVEVATKLANTAKYRYLEDAFSVTDQVIPYRTASQRVVGNGSPGVESAKGNGRPFINSLFANAFAGQSGDLSKVEMKIKGDPYWLGDTTTGVALPTGSHQGALFFMLSVRDQVLYNENTGLAVPEGYGNGLYQVQAILNEFSGGVFTQTIYGFINPKGQTVIMPTPAESDAALTSMSSTQASRQ